MKKTLSCVKAFEARQELPERPIFWPGDTVAVSIRIKEGNRERLQVFEGVVLARRNRGIRSSFKVRKMAHSVGVERTFPLYSPQLESIQVKKRGIVRQAKLYYLRKLTGRAARIPQKLS